MIAAPTQTRSSSFLLGIAFAALTGCGGAMDAATYGQTYKFADTDVSGWRQDSVANPYAVYTAATLSDPIDGAAPTYTDRGARVMMFQSLHGPADKTCLVIAMDFTTAAKATAMVAYQKTATSAAVSIPGYDTTAAVGAEALTGITAYAAAGASYFELRLDGFGDDKTAAAQAAKQLLDVLKRKTP